MQEINRGTERGKSCKIKIKLKTKARTRISETSFRLIYETEKLSLLRRMAKSSTGIVITTLTLSPC